MSILIKGMEMPKHGELLCINIYPDGKVVCNLDLRCKQIATAFPVPDHGRLVDLDKIENEIAQLSPEDYTAGVIRLILDSAPTIIPASKGGE